MVAFLENNLGIVFDGAFTVKEMLLAAVAVVVVLLIIAIIARAVIEHRKKMKTSIFLVKKNRYKSRLGKKNVKY